MKKTVFLMVLILAMLNFKSQAQQTLNYSNTKLIALFNPNNLLAVNENGIIQIIDANSSAKILDLEIKSINKLVKNNKNTVDRNEPVLILFNNHVNIESKIKQLMKTGLFKFVEPDFIGNGGSKCSYNSNDTYFSSRQWGLSNDGTFDSNSITDADIDMNNGWTITKGDTSIIVGILDSGVKPDHPEFAGRLWNNPFETLNGSDDDLNGYIDDIIGWDFVNNDNDPTDDHGHGTNVAGIIGSKSDNNLGYAGVDWNCKLINCKVIDNNNSGYYSWWISGIYYLVDNGADVINMSLGGSGYSAAMEIAVNYAYANNVPIVACMMNYDNNTTYYPAGYSNVISVGATGTNNYRVSPFFWGGGSNFGNHIDICAPGNYIYGLSAFSNTNYNSYWGGTSQATPLVTGVISLIKSLNPSLTVDSIRDLLREGSVDLVGNPIEDTPGWDQYHGHGLLNAYNTLKLVNSGIDVQTACENYTWIDGITYTSNNNIATWTLTNDKGCDSLVKLNLTINNATSDTDIQTACESYTWINGNTYTANNNTATWILTNSNGCDSIVNLNLSINKTDTSVIQTGSLLTAQEQGASYLWLKCPEMLPIIGAYSQSYLAITDGSYAVKVSKNGCSDTSNCYIIAGTGILENDFGKEFHIYPNPSSGNFSIDLGSKYSLLRTTLKDMKGKVIKSYEFRDSQILNLTLEESSGIYLLFIESGKKKAVIRLIKK